MSLLPGNKVPDAYRYDECLAAIKEHGDPLRAGNNTHLIELRGRGHSRIEVLFYSVPIAHLMPDRVVLLFDEVPATMTTADRMNRVLAGYVNKSWLEHEPNKPVTGIITVKDGKFLFGPTEVHNDVTVYGPSGDN